jgi:hypothetical protein
MFTFFHRRKKVTVDCFTSDGYAYKYAPIIRGPKAFPNWWTKLPVADPYDINYSSVKDMNMRKCYGFLELYKRSIILPSWTDFRFKVTPNNGYTWIKVSGPDPAEHSKIQFDGGFNDYYHSKLVSPWSFKEKTDVHFLFTAATWNLENYDFLIPPGVMEFGVNHNTNINLLIPKKKNEYFFYIPVAKPLVHMIPISDKKIEIRNHLISQDEMDRMFPPTTTMRGINPLLDIMYKEKKCPFGFN